MAHDADNFIEHAIPVGELMKNIANGYYWAYNLNRSQWMSIGNSPADDEFIDEEHEEIWGLSMAESGRRPWYSYRNYCDHILYDIASRAVANKPEILQFFQSNQSNLEEKQREAFRNISNAWRDEFALVSPIFPEYDGFPGDGAEIPSESNGAKWRMKTAEWRITMCYYAMYKSLSATVRSKDLRSLGHKKMLNFYSNQFMSSRIYYMYPYPLLFIPSNSQNFNPPDLPYPLGVPYRRSAHREMYEEERDRRIETYHDWLPDNLDQIDSHASSVSSYHGGPPTLFHIFRILREWASYDHGGIFSRLYGEGYVKYIDAALRLVSFSSMTLAEVLLIAAFGIDAFIQEASAYFESCERGIANSTTMVDYRFNAYLKIFSDW